LPGIDYAMEYRPDTNPFLTWTAAGAEAAGILGGMYFGLKQKKALAARRAIRPGTLPLTSAEQPWAAGVYKPINKYGFLKNPHYKAATDRVRWSVKMRRSLLRPTAVMGVLTAAAFGAEIGGGLFDVVTSYHRARRAGAESNIGTYSDVGFYDTRAAFTQRQRALMAIHNSQLSTRVAFGQEASYLHN